MSTANLTKSGADLAETVKRFLRDHPDVKQALDQFGMTVEQYQKTLAAQQKPVIYNGTSTM